MRVATDTRVQTVGGEKSVTGLGLEPRDKICDGIIIDTESKSTPLLCTSTCINFIPETMHLKGIKRTHHMVRRQLWNINVIISLPGRKKKVLLLFDYACHPCTGTMLIFSVYLSVCLMSQPEGWTKHFGKIKVYKVK